MEESLSISPSVREFRAEVRGFARERGMFSRSRLFRDLSFLAQGLGPYFTTAPPPSPSPSPRDVRDSRAPKTRDFRLPSLPLGRIATPRRPPRMYIPHTKSLSTPRRPSGTDEMSRDRNVSGAPGAVGGGRERGWGSLAPEFRDCRWGRMNASQNLDTGYTPSW